MPDRSENNKRLAKNTLMLYGRMLFNLLLAVFTSRMILAALGESDYGIYNVVGGVVSMFSVLTSAISSAISRFQTYELGKGEAGRLNDVFTASMWIQISFAIISLILIESIGVWFLNTHMTIPAERMRAANWVLQFSAFTFASGLMITPYSASVVSHEDMGVFAWISIYETVFKFAVALLLFYVIKHTDKLILYAVLLALSTFSMRMVYRFYCHKHYSECRLKMSFDKTIAREIFAYAGWTFVGNGALLLSSHGVNIVLNMIYGPVVNTARGLATTVNNIIAGFANNYSLALNPQIVKSYASGDKNYTIYIVERGGRFAFYIFFIVSLPVLLETEFLIDLWLVDVPQHTVNFVRLVLCITTMNLFSTTLETALLATGKIKWYELTLSLVRVLYFVSCYLILRESNLPPEFVYYLLFVGVVAYTVVRLLFARKYIGISILKYIKDVYLRMVLVMVAASVIPLAFKILLHTNVWLEFICISVVSVVCAASAAFFLGCNANEKRFIVENVRKFLSRMLK